MFWVFDVLINVLMEFFWVFVGDMLFLCQCMQGFVIQIILIGVGVVFVLVMLNILIEWFGVVMMAVEGVILDLVKYFFYIGGIVMFIVVGWIILLICEYLFE